MAAVTPVKQDTPHKSYACAVATTADPDAERSITFSIATISRYENSALEEEEIDNDDRVY